MPIQDKSPNSVPRKKAYKSSRRNRVPLSCEPCRARKPCHNCTVRDERASCKYESPKNISATELQHHPSKRGNSMQQRINHLEDLVKNLISQHQQAPVSTGGAGTGSSMETSVFKASDSTHSPSKKVIDGAYSVYKGGDDWYDVLQEINNLKQVWNESQGDQPGYNAAPTLPNMADGSSLLFGQVQRIDKIELLTTLPPKHQVDKLIHHFFDRENFPIPIVPILHEPTFMREYAEHWKDPTKTSVIWLGLLFSILSINMLAYQQFGEPLDYEGRSESLFQLYRLRTAQCLIVGDIAKCLPYTIETLRLNATAELNRKDDNSRGLWIMTAVLVRAAINMGYHRDPSQLPSIPPLQAEYRRRVWIAVSEMDDMASFVAGFPRMISSVYADTVEPRNVHDWELSDDLTVLPPSRPMTEATAVSYLIFKTRLFQALGRITDFNNTPTGGSYEQVLDIDSNLSRLYNDLPEELRLHSERWGCTASGKKATGSNMQLELLYHQGMCQLHRRFITKGRTNPQYNHSRDRCISSALAILEFQQFMEPFWYDFSRARKVLTLSAMILFLELECRRRTPDLNSVSSSNSSDDILQALNTCCVLWEKAQSVCDDPQKIFKILSGMLSSFQASATSSSLSQPETTSPLFEFPGMMNLSLQHGHDTFSEDKDWLSVSNEMIEMNIDWASWDAFIEGAIFENRD
ncbi:conserved hypothetical protein [Talaromyces stipitatus ATCC 10500]|uniref:Xylanolytic transcriptional activator regulatory domain-containing protein n=1 Tax=Talaromyces stipitatus (strain ATCC 10500 / CBS 375.48 / QM 6759 / NRRL 1006) TaxID=441959 RepID=B8M579_TALSN|nr:uncharacterized protein TSTA_029600 [Talaromyces stipitatus ATCC 10500]EED19685.1 conserved hypothetical protein [Talaromyces stipitatus ATCC 10500]